MSLLDELKKQRWLFLAGLATVLASASATKYFFPREVSNMGFYDKDLDGYVDVIEDKNWGIVLTNDSEYLIPVTDIDPSYKICYFSESISLTDKEFVQRTRRVLEDCLRKN